MTTPIIVTGTDTGVGKTVFSAALAGALEATYWKPVQAGLDEETDRLAVLRLSGLPETRLLAEAYRLTTPASPHLAAEIDGVAIDPEALVLPDTQGPLVVEGAGGLLVPLTRHVTYIDVFATWRAPVVLCARTTLGTINHTLLSIEALRARAIPLLGIAFIGDENAESERIIVELGRARRLGRLPHLAQLTTDALRAAFARNFNTADFLKETA
ncbi:dethiobiotin synthase [Rhodopseudomonas palustris BisB5]|uniref:ATP-dependent dethiobiotin synthetase BioD n=1 Tax=Rhodopseudomonas palustris (strain BisB5) TaxID=316057 RepID=BIOD_RHOPS|nr:RecName: Full=ATP-dependent dethiobiotin synthetase BioD; AltName: Full=DTB synthetase; Short=DTBS; AltName: Full=Dethiobiotin synthase [Rhodopseudomonas palustris BisB5]ABE41456.1 dethiobiotin synthase [Rhodopseudomonas palustris BisB5]